MACHWQAATAVAKAGFVWCGLMLCAMPICSNEARIACMLHTSHDFQGWPNDMPSGNTSCPVEPIAQIKIAHHQNVSCVVLFQVTTGAGGSLRAPTITQGLSAPSMPCVRPWLLWGRRGCRACGTDTCRHTSCCGLALLSLAWSPLWRSQLTGGVG